MGIIQCAESCKFQVDGYCVLDSLSAVNSTKNCCPYYLPALLDKRDGLPETFNTDNL